MPALGLANFVSRQATLSGSSETPVPTANLVLDVRAGIGLTLSGDEITAWADQSGAGNHLTGQTANSSRPTSKTDSAGNPVVRFQWGSGAAHPKGYFDIPASLSGIATRACAVYAVMAANSGTESMCLVSFDAFAAGYARVYNTSNVTPFMQVASRASTKRVPINKSVFSWVGRAADTAVAWNDSITSGIAAVGSATGLAGGDIGRYGGGASEYFSGDIYRLLIYSEAHTNLQMAEVIAALETSTPVVTTYDKLVAFEGDSLTIGVGSSNLRNYPNQIVSPNYDWLAFNLGKGSAKIGALATANTIANEAANQIDPLYSEFPYTRRVLVAFAGTNDIGADALTGAQTFTRLTDWLDTEVVVGWENWVITLPDRSAFDTEITDYNALIRAGDTAYSTVIDIGKGSAVTSLLSDSTNTTYFDADQLHLTNTGYGVVAQYVAAELNA